MSVSPCHLVIVPISPSVPEKRRGEVGLNYFQKWLARTKKKEVRIEWIHQFFRTILIFLSGPVFTILVLFLIQAGLPNSGEKKLTELLSIVIAQDDCIFLAFSLALSVILEGTLSSDSFRDLPGFVFLEMLAGTGAVIIYCLEKRAANTANVYLMNYRLIIHVLFLGLVILLAIYGYGRRIYDRAHKN